MPDLVQGGNVLRPKTSIKLSLRIPPSLDATDLERKLKELLESDPPYGAQVSFEPEKGGAGWVAPKVAPWLEQSVERASQTYFGKGAMTFGEGGSIPFMGMLGARYPERAVPHHRRPRPAQQRPRPERVPRHRATRRSSPRAWRRCWRRRSAGCERASAEALPRRDTSRRVTRLTRVSCPRTASPPLRSRIGSRFCGGGSGQVANGVNAQGGLYALLKSTITFPSVPGFAA